jgi:hypothetical protein
MVSGRPTEVTAVRPIYWTPARMLANSRAVSRPPGVNDYRLSTDIFREVWLSSGREVVGERISIREQLALVRAELRGAALNSIAMGLTSGQIARAPDEAMMRVEAAIHAGRLAVTIVHRPRVILQDKVVSPDWPKPKPKPDLDPIVDDDRALSITRCDSELGLEEPLRWTYLIRGLSGRPTTLRIWSDTFPSKLVHERGLVPAKTNDGVYDDTWDGQVVHPNEEQPRRLAPKYGPCTLEIVHDEVYRDEAKFTIAESGGLIPILQAEDMHFGNERVIFLPEPPRDPANDDAPETGVTGLSLARAVLQQAHLQPDKKVLFVGHADAPGSKQTNLTVSRARAENVKLFVTGVRDEWAKHCIGHYAADDVQNILLWAAATWGWDTFPGKVDNVLGPLTKDALDAFRREYNAEFESSIAETGPVSQTDWEAFFDLLQATLDAMLADGAPTLAELRADVNLLDDGVIACGEGWAHEPILMTGYPESSLRRVDVLFLDDHEVALAEIESKPPLREIYGNPLTIVQRLNADAVPFSRLDYEVWAALRSHWGDLSVGGVQYELIGPHPRQAIVREGVARNDGEIRETKLLAGNYELRIDGRLIPVAARIMGHHPEGLDRPSHIRIPEHASEHRPLHLFETPQSGEWIVPGFENDPNAEEPDPEQEDGVSDGV